MLLSGMGDLAGSAIPSSDSVWDSGQVFETANSTLTLGPLTIHGTSRTTDVTARPSAPGSKLLDAVLPIKTDASGKAKIFGLPPAVAYALAGLVVVGASYYGYKALSRRGLRIANPRKRRRRGRAKRRSKR